MVLPYGEWPSPLGAAEAAGGSRRFAGLAVSCPVGEPPVVWWSEVVGGHNEVWCHQGDGPAAIALPVVSARSRVNEYGGGAFWVDGHRLFWVEDADGRIRRCDAPTRRGAAATLLTPEPPAPGAWRFASGAVIPAAPGATRWMVCERERHVDDHGEPLAEAANELVVLRCDPDPAGPLDPVVLMGDADFLAAPCVSPDGRLLAWLRWDHPDMPWDAAELWVGELDLGAGAGAGNGAAPVLRDPRRLVGGRDDCAAAALGRAVSVCLPQWSPRGELYFSDDRDDRWLLRRAADPGALPAGGAEDAEVVWDGGGEVGEPRWVAGGGKVAILEGARILAAQSLDGLDGLHELPGGRRATTSSWVEVLAGGGDTAAAILGRVDEPTTVVRLVAGPDGTWEVEDLRPGASSLRSAWVSVPEPITFPTADAEVAHALFHPPRGDGVVGPEGTRPPLVVRIHGGPTAQARAELSTSVQFWTTRGFAVVEVNYRGSSGFGRRYRDLLRGRWGEAEVQDCLAAATHLAGRGLVDPRRCVIRGGSAGGFTALEAVCTVEGSTDDRAVRFAAATSLYGVTDLASMAADTHKFESRYLDGLIGALPEAAEVYRARSPLHHAERIAAPVLLLQGLEDRVVPPSQAEVLVAALERNGIDHEYRTYAGEGHGFRRFETLVDALDAELAFYGRVLGVHPSPAPAP